MSRIFLRLFWFSYLSVLLVGAQIDEFSFLGTRPEIPPTNSFQKIGSVVELLLRLNANEGIYTLRGFQNSDLTQVIAEKKDIVHEGGSQDIILRVPLAEGTNDFFLRIVETSSTGGEATTSTVSLPIVRDLEFDATGIRFNHIETQDSEVKLYTRLPTVKLFYTLHGNASQMQVSIFRNGQILTSVTKDGAGSYSEEAISVETNSLNLFQLKAASLDPLAPSTGFQAESNLLRIIHDDTPPNISSGGITTTFQGTPPPVGTAFGPTNLASFGLIVESDTPFARVRVLNTRTGNEVTRLAQNDGRLIIAGVELPRDPSLGALAFTTTTYAINVEDKAGNLTAQSIDVERLALQPCFNLLIMEPRDFGFLRRSQALSVLGAVCDDQKPHRIEFSVASKYSQNSFFLEEQLTGLREGESFDKDISIPSDTFQPFENVVLSIQAVVFTTNPVDPRIEEASPAHDLGVVILDLKPPAAPTILTEQVLFATNAPSLTIDGTLERDGSVDINTSDSFLVRPGKRIGAVGTEFRTVLDLGFVSDGEYTVDLIARDPAGNVGIGSQSKVILKYDRLAPAVKELKINRSPVELDRPVFSRSGDTVSIQILVDEFLAKPPRCFVTQQGAYGVEVGLTAVLAEGFEFEYQYVVQPALDGLLDGPVEIVVSGGSDPAGNSIVPAFREPRAFFVDTLPPVLLRQFVTPADGSVVNTAPTPLRMVMQEDPRTKEKGSGPDPFSSTITAFGPLEETPSRQISGRTEVFDPRTVDFYADPGEMNQDGTYLIEIRMKDRAGNSFVETIVLQLDTEIPSSRLIVDRFPLPGSFFNFQTLPRKNDLPFFSVAVEESLTPELVLSSTKAELLNFLRKPQKYKLSGPKVISTSSVEFVLNDDLSPAGEDDGILVAQIQIQDLATNLSDTDTFRFIYDTIKPKVMDGLNFPVPAGFSLQDLRTPRHGSVVRGPLRAISAPVYELKAANGFFGSGIQTEILSNSALPSTSISLELIEPLGSQPAGPINSGRIKFRGDLTQETPLYGGPAATRVLYELGVDNTSLEPMGLPTDGSFDGLYRMEISPVDMSSNSGEISTALFLYDTIAPVVSVDVLSESWISSSVIKLSGTAQDIATRSDFLEGFGSTKGLGIRTVEIQIESVNELGSATFPPLLEFTQVTLDRNPDQFPSNRRFTYSFERRFHDFKGPVRIMVQAFDKAGNRGRVIKDVGLQTDALKVPVPLEPAEGFHSQGGIMKFRWRPVEQASDYILEITDSGGNRHLQKFPFGTIEASLNVDFLPDGKTVWKVDAVDGIQNLSGSEQRRSFILDRKKPSVSDVVVTRPVISPDLQGRILESQVRVHISFSEEIDKNQPARVFFQPGAKQFVNSLGQSIVETFSPIELVLVELDRNQYTGMFRVLPLEEDSDFNGLGRILVEKIRDLAGNIGDDFSYEFELDLGPFFEFKIFSNPIRDTELIFVAKGLQAKGGTIEEIAEIPFMQVRQLKDPPNLSSDDQIVNVQLNRLGPSFFHGTFPLDLDLSGTLRIEITAGDLQGNRMTRILPFQVQRLSTSKSKILRNTSLAIFPFYTMDSQPVGLMPVFNAFPRTELSSKVPLEVKLGSYPLDRSRRYGIMRLDPDGTRKVVDQRRDGESVQFYSRNPSRLVWVEDLEAPEIEIDQSEDELLELRSDLSGHFLDGGVGLNCSRARAKSQDREFQLKCDSTRWSIPIREFPPRRAQQVELEVEDYAGNKSLKSLSVIAAGPVRIQEAVVIPNPVRNLGKFRLRASVSLQALNLSLYDSASQLLSSRSLEPDSQFFEQEIFSLFEVEPANGVYFLRVRVQDSRKFSDSRTLKFVILR